MSGCQIKTTIIATIEIESSTYGEDWKIGELRQQARREGALAVQNMVKGRGRLIGEPKVRVTVIDEEVK